MHLELDISDSKIRCGSTPHTPLASCAPTPHSEPCVSPSRYESGDHVAVYPANDSALVQQLGEILGADLDVVMSLNNLDGEPHHRPLPCLAPLAPLGWGPSGSPNHAYKPPSRDPPSQALERMWDHRGSRLGLVRRQAGCWEATGQGSVPPTSNSSQGA